MTYTVGLNLSMVVILRANDEPCSALGLCVV